MGRIIRISLLVTLATVAAFGQIKQRVVENGKLLYLSNEVVVKFKDADPSARGVAALPESAARALSAFGVFSVEPVFRSFSAQRSAPTRGIYSVKYAADLDPTYVARKLGQTADVLWAEPRFVHELAYDVNDPSESQQWYLAQISAPEAWDVTKSDASIIIGVVDTGVDWDHADLAANIWNNADETPGNGADDDGNGYVDDVRGWDFYGTSGTPDNDPDEDAADHGTHVAGIAAAATDNGVGVAGVGFNATIMPVKCSQHDQRSPETGSPYILNGYEGVQYAADNGAKVINCSWGGYGYSILGQTTIDYAISQGALVVAAAGNDASTDPHYPSAYEGVLSVAATTQSDARAYFSNYGETIDVCAPGVSMYNTWYPNTYTSIQGTSMASPVVAGLAALACDVYPTYTPEQIGELIRASCDDVSAANPGYDGMLGAGRVNALTTVASSGQKSARVVDFQFSDANTGDGDGVFDPGETVELIVSGVNYLEPTSALEIVLAPEYASLATVTAGSFSVGAVGTLGEFANASDPFVIELATDLLSNAEIPFLVTLSDGAYSATQLVSVVANPTYYDFSANDIRMTVTGAGNLGFNDYPANLQGLGFLYQESDNMLFEGAFLLSADGGRLSNAARGADQDFQDADFEIVRPYTVETPGVFSDADGYGVFNDDRSDSPVNVRVHMNSYGFADAPHNGYVIMRYRVVNTGGAALSNLRAGLFFDWDVVDGSGDVAAYDETGAFGYVRQDDGDPAYHIGVGVVSAHEDNCYSILNDDTRLWQIYDGFDDTEKFGAMATAKASAGPGDISHVVSAGPVGLPQDDTLDVAFAIAAGLSVEDLRDAFTNARAKWNAILTDVEDAPPAPREYALAQNFPNPFNPSTTLEFSLPQAAHASLSIFNPLGEEVARLVDEPRSAGTHRVSFDASNLSAGVYFYRLRAGDFSQTRKMTLLK
jgi:serine protease